MFRQDEISLDVPSLKRRAGRPQIVLAHYKDRLKRRLGRACAVDPNLEDAAFVQAVTSGNASLVRSPYADAIKTLAFSLAANQSFETGAPVRVATL